MKPRSACPSCGTELAWHDNVPVVSYLLLRGRCRSCHVPIGWIYPAVELAIGGLAAACFVHFGLSGEAFVASFFCAVLVVLSAIDLRHRIVPNRLVLPAALVVLVAQTALYPSPEWALGALGAAGFLFVAALAYPAGMGMGDVKLALLLGAMLGRVGLGGADARHDRRGHPKRHPARPARLRRAQDGNPLRAVPGDRRDVALFVGHGLLDASLELLAPADGG